MSGPDSCHVGQLSERAYIGCQQRAQMGDVGVVGVEEGIVRKVEVRVYRLSKYLIMFTFTSYDSINPQKPSYFQWGGLIALHKP